MELLKLNVQFKIINTMRIYRYIILVSFALLANSFTAEAQFLDKLQKRAEKRAKDKLEQKAEKKVDKTVDKAIDAPEKAVKESKKSDKSKKSKESNTKALDLSSMMNASESINLSDTYEFNQKVVYELSESTQGQKQEMTYWFSDDEQVFGIEMGYD